MITRFLALAALVVTAFTAPARATPVDPFDPDFRVIGFSVIFDYGLGLPSVRTNTRFSGYFAFNLNAAAMTGPTGDSSSARYGADVFADFHFTAFSGVPYLADFQISANSYLETYNGASYQDCTQGDGRGNPTCEQVVRDGWRIVLEDAVQERTFLFELLDTTGAGHLVDGTGLDTFWNSSRWELANRAFYGETSGWTGGPNDLLTANYGRIMPFIDARCVRNGIEGCRVDAAPVPLPAGLPLILGGLGLLWGLSRRKRRLG